MPKEPTKNPGLVRFAGILGAPKDRWGGWPWVAFPYSPKDLYGVPDGVPLVAIVDGRGFYSSIRRMGSPFGQPVVLVPKRIWRRLRKASGDAVEVSVALDVEQREVKAPPDLKAALSRNRAARAAFNKLHRLRRGEYVDWVNEAGQQSSRRRRIARTVEMLAEGRRLSSASLAGG